MINSKYKLKFLFYSAIHRVQEYFGIKRGRIYFEYLYSKNEDIWDYKTSHYEINKYRKSIEILSSKRYEYALEIGCSIGVFTRMLSEIVNDITAIDISGTAIKSAEKECENKNNVTFLVTDLFKFSTNKKFDLVCATEVLYYLAEDDAMIKSVVKIVTSVLQPGGILFYVTGRCERDRFNDWEAHFQDNCSDIKLLSTECIRDGSRDYRISILEKK